MKLIECYIENFGKLSSYRLKFCDGMNSYVHENGYGKTTVTEFIKAMLYGLSDTKKTDIAENDRRHYLPWGGGVCGGWLSFSAGGKEYRAERTFGAKAQDDTFIIYDLKLGKPTADYTENLGRELFGIDKDGFLRTIFLSERNLSGKNENKSISEKLSDTSGVDYDIGAMDEALKLLEERRKFYYKRGGGGEISSAESELKAYERELSALENMRAENGVLSTRLAEIKLEMQKLTEKRIEAQKQIEQIGREKEEQRLSEHYKRLKEENERKKSRLSDLNDFFKNGMPTPADIREASLAKIRSEELLRRDAPPKNEELEQLSKKFESVSKEEIEKAIGTSRRNKKNDVSPILLTLCMTVITTGIVMLFIEPLVYAFLLPMGVVTAILSALIVKRQQISQKSSNNIQDTLSLFGYSNDSLGIQRLYAEYTRFELLKSSEAALAEKRNEALRDAAELDEIAEKFLNLYPTKSEHPFDEISAMLSERAAIIEALADFTDDIPEYAQRKEPTAFLENTDELLHSIIQRLAELDSERLQIERRISVIESELEREDVISSDAREAKSKLELYRKNLFLLQKSRDFLSAARESMTARYLNKAKESFDKYVRLFSSENAEYIIDTSFEVSKSEYGAARKSDSFSLGIRNMQYLATRLALIDALYENEEPFLIFDDPFVSFDDERTARAAELLKKLSKNRQIIYFTCSSSRKI